MLDKSGSMRPDEYAKLGKLIAAGGLEGQIAIAGFDDDAASLAKVRDGELLDGADAARLLQDASAVKSGATPPAGSTAPKELLDPSGRGNYEEGLATALAWAKELPKESNVTRRMLVATDEPDFNPGVLKELQTVAKEKNLSMQVLYSFVEKNAERNVTTGSSLYGEVNADSFVIVDVALIESVDAFMVMRKEGSHEFQQLDWYRAAKAQKAKPRRWDAVK